MMKKLIICILLIFIFSLVNASILKKPEWKEGDYWKYEMRTIKNQNESISTTVIGKENITINNITYHCIVLKDIFLGEIRIEYLDEKNLATVKEIIYNKETKEKIYNPPSSFIQYPIFIGKKWETNVTDWKNTTTTIFFECTGKKDVTTKAGRFSCYVIKANYSFNGTITSYFYQLIYVSGRAGNIVRLEDYGNGTLVGYIELVSFHYNAGSTNQENNMIIIATIVIVIFVLSFILYKIFL